MKEICWFVYNFRFLPSRYINNIVKLYTIIRILDGRIWKYREQDFAGIWICWGIDR